jgi:hypothetical protein
VKWKGPRRVASVESYYVFVVDNLLTKELKASHATRLRFYQYKVLHVTEKLDQAAEQNNKRVECCVVDIRHPIYNEQKRFYELLAAWRGFPVGEATWKPYSFMAVDLPEMVANSWSLKTTQAWCARRDVFESSHGKVLCVAKDKKANDFICKRF